MVLPLVWAALVAGGGLVWSAWDTHKENARKEQLRKEDELSKTDPATAYTMRRERERREERERAAAEQFWARGQEAVYGEIDRLIEKMRPMVFDDRMQEIHRFCFQPRANLDLLEGRCQVRGMRDPVVTGMLQNIREYRRWRARQG